MYINAYWIIKILSLNVWWFIGKKKLFLFLNDLSYFTVDISDYFWTATTNNLIKKLTTNHDPLSKQTIITDTLLLFVLIVVEKKITFTIELDEFSELIFNWLKYSSVKTKSS